MYVIGMVMGILVAMVQHKLEKGKINQSLMIELPEYKRPNARTIRTYVWNKLKDYLTKAGTTIFVASIIIWFILNFGIHGMVSDPAEARRGAGKDFGACPAACRPGAVADSGCTDFRYFRKRSGGFLLLRPVWRLQCEFGSRYGLHRAEYPAF